MSFLKKLRNFSNKVLPPSFFKIVRFNYFKIKRLSIRPISKEEFKTLLVERMKIEEGATVFIHSSLGHLKLRFSVGEIIKIIREIIGENGNILFPTTHFNEKAESYLRKGGSFDVRKSHAIFGLLPELARRDKNAKRSLHPTNSVVAIGPDAEFLLNEQHLSVYPLGEKSPYYKMLKLNSIIIGLGVSSDYLSFTHCPEDVCPDRFSSIKPRLDEIFSVKVKGYNNEEILVKTLVASPSIKNRDVPKYIKKNIPKEIGEDFKYRGASFFYFKAKPLFERMIELAGKEVTIYNP